MLKDYYLLEDSIILLENELLKKEKRKGDLIIFDMKIQQIEGKGTIRDKIIKEFRDKKYNMELAYGYIIYNFREFIRDNLKEEKELIQIKILLEILKNNV